MAEDLHAHPLDEPLAQLERRLIDEYLRGAGHDPETIHARHDPQARAVMTDAATYAAARLAEVEARSHYVRNLHGQE
jgi:hypothetical protein